MGSNICIIQFFGDGKRARQTGWPAAPIFGRYPFSVLGHDLQSFKRYDCPDQDGSRIVFFTLKINGKSAIF
jgi:hypothetical protein